MKEKLHGEAIDIGLKTLGITKEEAEIKILENEDKRSFFSILAPRVVKVEIISKKEIKEEKKLIYKALYVYLTSKIIYHIKVKHNENKIIKNIKICEIIETYL